MIDKRYVADRSVHIWILVDTYGRVRNTALLKSSGDREVDEVAMKVAMEFEFTPARLRGKVVPAWITMPISLKITKNPYQPLPPPPHPRQ